MVRLERDGDTMVFQVVGLHKIWALKKRLEIPMANIRSARKDPNAVRGWKGWKAPGTYLPGLITAGTFYHKGQRIFWDVCNTEKAIVVDLDHEHYHQLIIEVVEPDAAIQLLTTGA